MDTRRREPQPGNDFARRAESLIRSLAGVVSARVHSTPGGIDAIHVIAADDDAAARMAAHVRSALLAGLATPVVPTRIHVRTGTGGRPEPGVAGEDEPGPPRDEVPQTAPDRLQLIHAAEAAESAARKAGREQTASPQDPADTAVATPPEKPVHERARLVAVDVHKPGEGRIVCRVSIAWNADVHRAEAIAVDLPGAAAQAAAQAAVRALADAGVNGLELNGLREVEIAGRDYVLVALRRTDGTAVRLRSGSALMLGTPERSAAEASISAANELL